MDYHIRVKLDPQFSGLVDDANINGYFVVKRICEVAMTPWTVQAAVEFIVTFTGLAISFTNNRYAT